MNTCVRQPFLQLFMGNIYVCVLKYIMYTSQMCIHTMNSTCSLFVSLHDARVNLQSIM